MRRYFHKTLLAFLCLSNFGQAEAQQRQSLVSVEQKGKGLSDDQLYRVKYSCSSSKNLLPSFLSRPVIEFPILTRSKSATHVFAVTTGGVNLTNFSFEAPTTTTLFAPYHVFTVEGANIKGQSGTSCGDELFVTGFDHPKVAYILKFETDGLPVAAVRAITLLNDTLAPIFHIIKGKEPNDRTKEAQTQVQTIVSKYNEYLQFFKDRQESEANALDLKEGRNRLITRASTITIDVTPVESALHSAAPFRAGIKKFVALTIPTDISKPAEVCRKLQRDLIDSGFRSPADQAYILYRNLAFDSKKKYIECLDPNELAPFVINDRRLYVGYVPNAVLITRDDVQAYLDEIGAVPAPGANRKTDVAVDFLTDTFSRFGALNIIPSSDRTNLEKYAAETITFDDQTTVATLSDASAGGNDRQTVTSGALAQQLERLTKRNYRRFGCYQVTSEPTVQGFDGASAMILAAKATDEKKPDGTQKAVDELKKETVGLRLFFERDRLVKVVATNKYVTEVRAKNTTCAL
jgi:hypothetical protein